MEIGRVAAWLERPDLLGIFLVGLVIFVVGRIPFVGLIIYPLALFYVFVHELAHGFVAQLSGRQFDRFHVKRNLTGAAWRAPGESVAVTSAGYVGGAFFGALLIFLAEGSFPARVTLFSIGLVLALLCLRYVRNGFGILSGFALAGALMYGAVTLGETGAQVLLWLLAVIIFVETFADLFGVSRLGRGIPDDSKKVAGYLRLPAPIVQLIWAGLAALFLLYALNLAYGVPLPWAGL